MCDKDEFGGPQAKLDGHQGGLLLDVCQKAYRKHVLNDDSIGWENLGDEMCNALNEAMGPQGFCDWLDKVGPDKSAAET